MNVGQTLLTSMVVVAGLALSPPDAIAETCQDVLKAKTKPITYQVLYNIVSGKKLSKDEFESTAGYEKRISEALASVNSAIK